MLTLIFSLLSLVATPGPRGCFDPADYGAIPNDGISDRVAMQTTIDLADGGGTVCLGAGRFTCERAGPGTYSRTACLNTHGKHITFMGTGPGTVIELRGDQTFQQTLVFAIEPGAGDITIKGITFDTTGAYSTEEQTHVIATTNNRPSANPPYDKIEGLTIQDVRFVHPYGVVGQRKGDCIRLGSIVPVIDTKIIGSTFDDCARSGIELQYGIHGAKIIANTFRMKSVDQDIDGEASGDWVYDVQILGNTFEDGPDTAGDWSVSCTNCMRLIVADNLFLSRGLILVRSKDALIHHNVFDVTYRFTSEAVIESANVCDGLVVESNKVRRHGRNGFGIRVGPHGQNGPPNDVTIRGNKIYIDGDSGGVHVHSPDGLRIENNDVTWTAASAPNGIGILISAGIRVANNVRITGNITKGTSYWSSIRLSASLGLTYLGLRVKDNESLGGTRSLHCDLMSVLGGPIVTGGNLWATPSNCTSGTQSLFTLGE